MLTLRLNRQGTKDRPFYKIVAVDSRKRRDGRYIEQIGSYNPMEDGVNFTLDVAKAEDWIAKGAQPSDTVRDIIKKSSQGITLFRGIGFHCFLINLFIERTGLAGAFLFVFGDETTWLPPSNSCHEFIVSRHMNPMRASI